MQDGVHASGRLSTFIHRWLAQGVRAALNALPTLLALSLLGGAHTAQAAAPACDVYGAPLQQVSASVWFVQGASELGSRENHNFIANAAFVVTPDGVVAIDALGSPLLAQRWIECIHTVTPLPIKVVVVTHYHADHIYGLQAFQAAGARVVAQEHGREYLQSDTARNRLLASREAFSPWVDDNTRLVPADEWLPGDSTFTLGDTTFQLLWVGPGHTAEDLAVFLPNERVLIAGDLVFRGRVPYVGHDDSSQWIHSLERLLALQPKVLVPGHGPASHDPIADIRLTRDYLAYLRQTMGPPARELLPFDEAYAAVDWSPFAQVPMFSIANRMNAYNVYLQMQEER